MEPIRKLALRPSLAERWALRPRKRETQLGGHPGSHASAESRRILRCFCTQLQ